MGVGHNRGVTTQNENNSFSIGRGQNGVHVSTNGFSVIDGGRGYFTQTTGQFWGVHGLHLGDNIRTFNKFVGRRGVHANLRNLYGYGTLDLTTQRVGQVYLDGLNGARFATRYLVIGFTFGNVLRGRYLRVLQRVGHPTLRFSFTTMKLWGFTGTFRRDYFSQTIYTCGNICTTFFDNMVRTRGRVLNALFVYGYRTTHTRYVHHLQNKRDKLFHR